MNDVAQMDVTIPAGRVELPGILALPPDARGIVVFAHGSGSSRFSPRNQEVAAALRGSGFGTLLFDLLTAEEERVDLITRHLRFDIGLLARRLLLAAGWAARQPETRGLPLGFFGASTGAAAALVAASHGPLPEGGGELFGIVSRGGRPDLAGAALEYVEAPVLLLVGSLDQEVLELNRQALRALTHAKSRQLEIVPGASHLFEEPGALAQVTRLAATWLRDRAEEAPAPRRQARRRPRPQPTSGPEERL